MYEKEIEKLIGAGVVVIVVYYIISAFINYVILAVVVMVAVRVYQELNRR